MNPQKGLPFAIIPAAGRSRRMGSPKLLLGIDGQTVIARLLDALERGGVDDRIVVVRADDAALRDEIERHGGRAIVAPIDPPDMRTSVSIGLRAVLTELREGDDGVGTRPWLLVPGDHPIVLPAVVRALLEAAALQPGRIFVPRFRGRRGHPTVFALSHAAEIDKLPPEQGINALLKRDPSEVTEIEVDSESVLFDLDTPGDLNRLRSIWAERDRKANPS